MPRQLAVCGLPQSGKTTFLAALWHLLTSDETPSKLRFGSLELGDYSYLNEIAVRWREGKVQNRTPVSADKVISISVRREDAPPFALTFPDVSGELFSEMWELRQCSAELAAQMRASSGVLLFIHADTIESPQWVVDVVSLSRRLGVQVDPQHPAEWNPRLAPNQVKIVELLQLFAAPQLGDGARSVAVVFSAWDKVEIERLTPGAFLATRLPLLDQYLREGADNWRFNSWGVSAQGGDYANPEARMEGELTANLERLLSLDRASDRIVLVSDHGRSNDLTEPVAWLLQTE